MEHSNEFPDLTMQFHNPPPQFRMMPLWFWNHEIRPSIIKSQIEDMARHGMGGFFINARPGRLTPYMSKNFLEQIEYAADCSQAMNLWCNLYDEDNYPSGFAGGKITGPDFPENRAVNFPPNTKQFKLDFPPYQSYCLSFHNSGKKIETKGNFDLIEFSRKKNDHFSSKKIELSSNWNLILDGNNAAFLGKNWHFAIKSWAIDEFKYGTTYTYSHKFILQSKEQIGQLSLMIDGLVGDRCWGKDFYDELKGGQYAQFDPKSIPKITINNSPIHINFDYKIKYLDPFWLISDITPLVQNGENIITVVSESHVDKFYAHLITDPWKIIGKFCVNEKNADNIPILSPIITKVSCEDLNLLGLSHYYGTLRYEQLVQMPDKSNCRATLCLHDIKDCVEIHINHKPLSVCWWNWTVDISNYVKWGNENIITLFYNGTAQNFIESDSHPFGIQGKIEVIIENL